MFNSFTNHFFGLLQKCRMIRNMLTNKTGDEVIAMIVAFVEAHIDRLVCRTTGFNKIFGTQLCWQKLIF